MPVITEQVQTSTQDLDCMPVVEPTCPSDQYVNGENKCVAQSDCKSEKYCGGKGGYYDETNSDCFCEGTSDPGFFCDA